MSNNFLDDKNIVNVLLDNHKLAATSYTNLVLESSNQYLRNDITSLLNRTFQHQKQIFDIMNKKGWYQTQTASQQDITNAKQAISNINVNFS